jgi:hypothetical protein
MTPGRFTHEAACPTPSRAQHASFRHRPDALSTAQRGVWCSTVPDVQRDAEQRGSCERSNRHGIRQSRTGVEPRQFPDEELNVRRRILVAQACPHLPMPVGTWTVSPTVPGTETKPGQSSERQGCELPRPSSPPDPPQAVECNPRGVEHEEEDVEYRVQFVLRTSTRPPGQTPWELKATT